MTWRTSHSILQTEEIFQNDFKESCSSEDDAQLSFKYFGNFCWFLRYSQTSDSTLKTNEIFQNEFKESCSNITGNFFLVLEIFLNFWFYLTNQRNISEWIQGKLFLWRWRTTFVQKHLEISTGCGDILKLLILPKNQRDISEWIQGKLFLCGWRTTFVQIFLEISAGYGDILEDVRSPVGWRLHAATDASTFRLTCRITLFIITFLLLPPPPPFYFLYSSSILPPSPPPTPPPLTRCYIHEYTCELFL